MTKAPSNYPETFSFYGMAGTKKRIDAVVPRGDFSPYVRGLIEIDLTRRERPVDGLQMFLESCPRYEVTKEVFVPTWQTRMKADYDRETEELLALIRRNQINEQEDT